MGELQVPPGVRVLVDPGFTLPQPTGTTADGRPVYSAPAGAGGADLRWLIGFAGTWLVLSILSDNPNTQGFASVLSLVVAGSATLLLLPKAAQSLGVG